MNQMSNDIRIFIVSGWMTALRAALSIVMLTVILVGCGGYVMLFSETQTYTGKDSLVLRVPRPDILDIIAEVGKSLGYSVSALDREAGTISLSSSTTMLSTVFVGKISNATLSLSLKDGRKKLDIMVMAIGNLGAGGQEKAMSLVNDFKARLLEKIK